MSPSAQPAAAAKLWDSLCTTCIVLRPWLSVTNLLPRALSVQLAGSCSPQDSALQVQVQPHSASWQALQLHVYLQHMHRVAVCVLHWA